MVFEDRYRQLIVECLAESEPFGIVLIREGREVGGAALPHPVGTTARVRSVRPDAAGRLHVTARGERRFRIIEPYSDRPYLSAAVEYPVDEVTSLPEGLAERTAEGYRQLARLQQTMEGLYARSARVPDSPTTLADAIAAAAAPVVPPLRLQSLLETFDLRRRLEGAGELLGEIVEVTHRHAREVVAQRWGGVERRN